MDFLISTYYTLSCLMYLFPFFVHADLLADFRWEFHCSLGGRRCAIFPSLGQDTDAAALSARVQGRGAGHCRPFAVADSAAALAAVATFTVVEPVAISAARSAVGRSRQRQQVRLTRSGRHPPQPVHGEFIKRSMRIHLDA
jgi:hypothetical protein